MSLDLGELPQNQAPSSKPTHSNTSDVSYAKKTLGVCEKNMELKLIFTAKWEFMTATASCDKWISVKHLV